jgi:transposase
MPRTEITRAQYRRSGLCYASDMTDAEWALIARRMPGRLHPGRPREVDLRKVVQAILFILSSGCQWRALPKEFPPYSTVPQRSHRVRGSLRKSDSWREPLTIADASHRRSSIKNGGRRPPLPSPREERGEREETHFFTLPASILTEVSSIFVENAVCTSNGFSMPR